MAEAPEFLTTKQVADRLDITEGWVRVLCGNGMIEASKHGRSWVITPAALERYEMQRNFNASPRRNGNQ